MTIRVHKVADPDALEALLPEWEALEATLSPWTPFTSPSWNLLWWQHLRAKQSLVRDEFFVHTVRDEDVLLAVAPMMLTYRPATGPFRVRALRYFGTDPNVTEVRGLACRHGFEEPAMQALMAHFHASSDDWDWLEWGGIREPAVASQLRQTSEPALTRQIPCYYLSLPDTWSAFKSGLSRNVKESLRKCYNSLKRDGHAFVFRAIDQPAHVDPALDRFFHLHTVRAQATGTIEHTDVFRTRKTRDFLRAYGQRMAERGRFVVFQLEIGGEVVATRVAMIFGDQLYLYYSGYNISWARYSVMTTLVAEAIQWAIDRRFKVVNLSTGSDVSKTRWSPHEVIFTEGLQRSSTPRGQLSFRVYHKVRAYSRRYLRLKKSLAVARRAE